MQISIPILSLIILVLTLVSSSQTCMSRRCDFKVLKNEKSSASQLQQFYENYLKKACSFGSNEIEQFFKLLMKHKLVTQDNIGTFMENLASKLDTITNEEVNFFNSQSDNAGNELKTQINQKKCDPKETISNFIKDYCNRLDAGYFDLLHLRSLIFKQHQKIDSSLITNILTECRFSFVKRNKELGDGYKEPSFNYITILPDNLNNLVYSNKEDARKLVQALLNFKMYKDEEEQVGFYEQHYFEKLQPIIDKILKDAYAQLLDKEKSFFTIKGKLNRSELKKYAMMQDNNLSQSKRM